MNKHAEINALVLGLSIIIAATACSELSHSARTAPSKPSSIDNAEDALRLSLPVTPVGPFNTTPFTFEVSNSNTPPSDPNAWLGLDEKQVFLKRLSHTQNGSNWTMKVGKGGQIYSISTPQTGEMVAIQRKVLGQWVDEVFQHVIPSALYQKDTSFTVVDGDIHQAGYYTQSDLDPKVQILNQSVYSPVFPATHLDFLEAKNSFALTTWPQHAHLPRTYSENGMLMHQLTRDLGDGVVEVTLLVNKWQGVQTLDINLPWSAWRKQNLPAVLVSNPDGSYTRSDQPFRQAPELLKQGLGQRKLLKAGTPNWTPDTGGWIAVAQSENSESMGVGIIFGQNASAIEGDASYVRWGNYSIGTAEEGTVVSVKRNVPLMPGDTVFARYFLVIGPVSKIQYYGNMLQSRVELGRMSNEEQKTGLMCIAQDPVLKLRRGCPDSSAALFYAYRDFQPNSQPLFLLGRKDGTSLLSTDPYGVSSDPTDGQTVSYSFLGWALPKGDVPTFRYLKLAAIRPTAGLEISSTALPLYVRSTDLSDPTKLSSDASIKSISSSSGQSINPSVSPISVQLKASPLTVTVTVAERATVALVKDSSILRSSTGPTLSFMTNEWPDIANYWLIVTAEDGTKASYVLKLLPPSTDSTIKSITTSDGQSINLSVSPMNVQLKNTPMNVSIRVFERATVSLVKGSNTLRSSTGPTLSFATNEWPDITAYWVVVRAENGTSASYILRLLPAQ